MYNGRMAYVVDAASCLVRAALADLPGKGCTPPAPRHNPCEVRLRLQGIAELSLARAACGRAPFATVHAIGWPGSAPPLPCLPVARGEWHGNFRFAGPESVSCLVPVNLSRQALSYVLKPVHRKEEAVDHSSGMINSSSVFTSKSVT